MRGFKLPGTVGIAIVALIPMLIDWLQGDWSAGEQWVPFAIIVLTALAKGIEAYQAIYGSGVRSARWASPPSSWWQMWLWG